MVDVAPLGKRVSNGKRVPEYVRFPARHRLYSYFLCNEPSRCYLLRVIATRLNLVELNLIVSQFGRNPLFHLICFNTLAKKITFLAIFSGLALPNDPKTERFLDYEQSLLFGGSVARV